MKGFKVLIIFLSFVLLFSCSLNNDFDYNFNKLINEDFENIVLDKNEIFHESQVLESIGLRPPNTPPFNESYYKLFKMGKSINSKLLNKMHSIKETKWRNYPFFFEMTEGDIAIKLFLEINPIENSRFIEIVPENIKEDYIDSKGNAHYWWYYLRKNQENRKEVIKLINEYFYEPKEDEHE